MLEFINRGFLAILLLAAISGILISATLLLLDMVMHESLEEQLSAYERDGLFFIEPSIPGQAGLSEIAPSNFTFESNDSPFLMNITLKTPPLSDEDVLIVEVSGDGKTVSQTDCLDRIRNPPEREDSTEVISAPLPVSILGLMKLDCEIPVPYDYSETEDYAIVGKLTQNGNDYSSNIINIKGGWIGYEDLFWSISTMFMLFLAMIYLLLLFPISIGVLVTASRLKHENAAPEEYSIRSLFDPLSAAKGLKRKLNAFLVSPYFWSIEMLGIIGILIYLAISAEPWKSMAALAAFFISGALAFAIPFLWVVAWWYAEYREREPLRIIVTCFLWGMFAALMAIGINSIGGDVFGYFGLGFLGVFLIAPFVEELFKGSGAALLSEHFEFNSIEDGLVYGFVIGMGFAFIENWLYFLQNPMGSDLGGWFILFILRSIVFSANHGFYTAITGGMIGYLIEKGFKAPALGLLVALPIAAFFHSMHNSSIFLMSVLGLSGVFVYCCLFIPIFDYGGIIVLFLLFMRSVLRKKP